jgi:hypothetical protein
MPCHKNGKVMRNVSYYIWAMNATKIYSYGCEQV